MRKRHKRNFVPRLSSFVLHSSARGFTLVEVLIASTVLAFGLLLVIEVMARCQNGMRAAENLVIASQLAEEKVVQSEIQVREFIKLSSGADQGEEKLPGKLFNWEKIIKPFQHVTILDERKLNKVSVSLGWKEGKERKGGFDVEGLVVNRERVIK